MACPGWPFARVREHFRRTFTPWPAPYFIDLPLPRFRLVRNELPPAMFTLSAFADEIGPDPEHQITVLKTCGVRHIELRSILGTNVLDLTDLQVQEFRSLLRRLDFRISAIGSPIGKIPIDQPFEPHLARFRRAVELCKVFETRNIRVFSYYLPEAGEWDNWRRDVLDRMWDKLKIAEQADVRLIHENEHRIYGDDPERVADLMETVLEQVDARYFGSVYDPANYVFCGFDSWHGWQRTTMDRAFSHKRLDPR